MQTGLCKNDNLCLYSIYTEGFCIVFKVSRSWQCNYKGMCAAELKNNNKSWLCNTFVVSSWVCGHSKRFVVSWSTMYDPRAEWQIFDLVLLCVLSVHQGSQIAGLGLTVTSWSHIVLLCSVNAETQLHWIQLGVSDTILVYLPNKLPCLLPSPFFLKDCVAVYI